jgi:hypothetical protein
MDAVDDGIDLEEAGGPAARPAHDGAVVANAGHDALSLPGAAGGMAADQPVEEGPFVACHGGDYSRRGRRG